MYSRWYYKWLSQSAFFNLDSMLIVILLFICTSSYLRLIMPSYIEPHK